jgi:3-oxoacyl-[acyl-carrier protein] reductase
MDLGLTGKTALVTASSRGIGKAIAQGLAAEGCRVIICSRDKDNLLKAAQEIEAKTGQLITLIQVDLSQKDSIEQFLKHITNQFSTIDILVNNVGGMPYKLHYELNQAPPRIGCPIYRPKTRNQISHPSELSDSTSRLDKLD